MMPATQRSMLIITATFAMLIALLVMPQQAAADRPDAAGDGVRVVVVSAGGVKTIEWLVNGRLVASTVEIVTPGGSFRSTTRFFPNGNLYSTETRSITGTSESTSVQHFSPRSGQLKRDVTQQKENGVVIAETMTVFDGHGNARVQRSRVLTVNDEGAQVYRLTTATFVDGVAVVRNQVDVPFNEYPGRSLMNRPPAPPGQVRKAESSSDAVAENQGNEAGKVQGNRNDQGSGHGQGVGHGRGH